ncbi:CapA family protein [Peribacillus alkalitolerans]|uniref:CapA family protein n=1 Tax=Peribacillus alkalitolerans TaxID=1550385 RepID=UPI0013D70A49|nr:CapA family protein [Peribacillus alkalitolerans]
MNVLLKRIMIILIAIFITSGCMPQLIKPDRDRDRDKTKNEKNTVIAPVTHKTNVKPIVHQVTIGAIGDILIHNEVYEDAKQTDGTYNFDKMFSEVKQTMQKPDILVANQETMIGGEEFGLSSYPSFNSPHEVGDALKNAGVDLVTLANNHSLDRGEKVINSALAYWDKINMPYTGVFKSQADHDKIRTITKNDITLSFLAYTFGTNGIPVPKGKDYLVNLIDVEKLRQDVNNAKGMSDVVVVSMHWGNEYERFPNETQKKLAQDLSDMGVNIIIGHHPHVLQPPSWLFGKNGNKTFVLYSLGNFLSAQDELYQLIGGLASIDIIKTKTKNKTTIDLKNPSFTLTYNYYLDNRQFKIIPMEHLASEFLMNSNEKFEETKKHMQAYLNDLEIMPSVKISEHNSSSFSN